MLRSRAKSSSSKQAARDLFDSAIGAFTLEGVDDPDAERDAMERKCPGGRKVMEVERKSVDAQPHNTKPPARYTDATLIKKLEEQGIGRPSTYATIIATIVDSGYHPEGGQAACAHLEGLSDHGSPRKELSRVAH